MNLNQIIDALNICPISEIRLGQMDRLKDYLIEVKEYFDECYDEEGGCEFATCIETPGDLGELTIIIQNYPKENNLNTLVYDLDQAIDILYIMELYDRSYLGSYEELRRVPNIKKFFKRYPNLYRTFEVWIWS